MKLNENLMPLFFAILCSICFYAGFVLGGIIIKNDIARIIEQRALDTFTAEYDLRTGKLVYVDDAVKYIITGEK